MSQRQFGTMRKLASGRWQVRYPDGSGLRIPADRTFPTKADAARFLASAQTDMARGQFLDPRDGKITLKQWTEEWLALPGKRAASIAHDRQALGVFLPDLGMLPLSAITPKHVQAAVNARAKRAAPATLRRDFAALRAVLNAAVDADRIARSPLGRSLSLRSLRRTTRHFRLKGSPSWLTPCLGTIERLSSQEPSSACAGARQSVYGCAISTSPAAP